ncbi:MAG: glycosyltransferase family protein [Euryarchaeota archaeon]|nr:glycosyltransferase family protein [Euryarchaeota archaeon]
MSRVVAIVQARMSSTRLPGKVLMDIAGMSMLARSVRRLSRAKSLSEVVVATTIEKSDDPIVEQCEINGWKYFRGSREDVLDRYHSTATSFRADGVVRITSDCPMIDPGMVDAVLDEFFKWEGDVDYLSNMIPRRTYPRGLDTEVFTFDALDLAWKQDTNPSWREHVTQYILRHPEIFRIRGIMNDIDYSSMRWTVDTPEDLRFARTVLENFQNDQFTWKEIVEFLQARPDILEINKEIRQKALPS